MQRPDEHLWKTTLHEEFTQTAHRFGTRIAIKDSVISLTYAEIAARSDAYVASILERCAGRAGAVAIAMAKGPELVAAMLGVWKAGGYCLCLDDKLPIERQRLMLRGASASMLIADDEIPSPEPSLPVLTPSQVRPPVLPTVGGGDPCFIINSSGTTGESLGILVTHRSWLHTVDRHNRLLDLGPGDRVSWLALPWSAAGLSTPVAALINGATLYPFDVRTRGPAAMCRWVQKQKITVLHSTPTVFRSLLNAVSDLATLESVRLMRVGGEQVFSRDLAQFKKHFPVDACMINGYGSSEAGYIAAQVLNDSHLGWEGPLPVGHVSDGVEVIIVNADHQIITNDEPGQIIVRSRWLPLGYVGNEVLTQKRFRTLDESSSLRECLTGDLGAWTAPGVLQHLGRTDDEIKVIGWRVNRVALESAIRGLDTVQDAAVLLNDEGVLCAYVVSTTPGDLLRTALHTALPNYLGTVSWIPVSSIPLTASGKTDRRALLAIKRGNNSTAPRSPLEAALLESWHRVFDDTSLGIYDHFFTLGGTSLQALTLLESIKARTQHTVSPAMLMERPTVAQLAEVLTKPDSQQLPQKLVCLHAADSGQPVIILPGGWAGENELLLFASMLPHLPNDRPVYGLRRDWRQEEISNYPNENEMAEQIIEDIQARIGMESCSIVGECIAGPLAMVVAKRLGAQVNQLILLAPLRVTTRNRTGIPPAVAAYLNVLARLELEPPTCPVQLIFGKEEADLMDTRAYWEALTAARDCAIVLGDHHSYLRKHQVTTAQELARFLMGGSYFR